MQCWWLIKLKWTVQSKQRIHASVVPQRSSTFNNSSCTAFLLYSKAPIQIWDDAKHQPPIICNNLNWNNKNAISCSCWGATSPNTNIFMWERSHLLHLFLSGSVWVKNFPLSPMRCLRCFLRKAAAPETLLRFHREIVTGPKRTVRQEKVKNRLRIGQEKDKIQMFVFQNRIKDTWNWWLTIIHGPWTIDYKLDLNLPLFQNSLESELNIFQG